MRKSVIAGKKSEKRDKRRRHGSAASNRTSKPKPDKGFKELREKYEEESRQRRLAWLLRPNVHTAAFEDLPAGTVEPRDRAAYRARKREELAKALDWSDERLALFKQRVVAYRKRPIVENYVRIRQEFPEVEIRVGHFGGLEALFKLEDEFVRQGVDPDLVAGSLDADEPDIDALSLRLLELIVARSKLPKSGSGYIEKRRGAINDPTINYLIVETLEAMDWHGTPIRIPASFVVLIREQLCGSKPDLLQMYLSRERFQNAASLAGQYFHQTNKKLSVRQLMTIAGVGRGTAARWLADKDFPSWFEFGRKLAADEPNPAQAVGKRSRPKR